MSLPEIVKAFVSENALVHGQPYTAKPLTGGVASDIWRIESTDRTFVVKKALAKLKVSEDWHVPVERNAYEVAWMLEAKNIVPDAVPTILAHDPKKGVFAMNYFEPESHPVWKAELLDGRVNESMAGYVGQTLGSIHAFTADNPTLAKRFNHDALFHAIRLEPYLEATAAKHPTLKPQLLALCEQVLKTKRVLVHGDVSPKNILLAENGPILLDAECAWYGDPSFDLAFCLNHLLLKSIHRPEDRDALLASFATLAQQYLRVVNWERTEDLEARTAALLPALTLARIDGKSPVEYLVDESKRNNVRSVTTVLIKDPVTSLDDLLHTWLNGVFEG